MRKALDVIVKIAGLVITAPVTVGIAGQVFADVQPVALRWLVQVAALVVVEFVFLSAWWALDNDRAAPQAVKSRNAITALVMYGGLWLLALQHGEGPAGIVFRLALGLALAGSIYDSGVYETIRGNAAADKDISRDGKVKRHARDLARKAAIADLDAQHGLAAARRDADSAIEAQRIALSKSRGLSAVKVENRAIIQDSDARFPMNIETTRAIRDGQRASKKERLLPRVKALHAAGVNNAEIGRELKVARQTVSKWLGEDHDNGNAITTDSDSQDGQRAA